MKWALGARAATTSAPSRNTIAVTSGGGALESRFDRREQYQSGAPISPLFFLIWWRRIRRRPLAERTKRRRRPLKVPPAVQYYSTYSSITRDTALMGCESSSSLRRCVVQYVGMYTTVLVQCFWKARRACYPFRLLSRFERRKQLL